jgi:predicted RNA-binding protein
MADLVFKNTSWGLRMAMNGLADKIENATGIIVEVQREKPRQLFLVSKNRYVDVFVALQEEREDGEGLYYTCVDQSDLLDTQKHKK